MLASRILKRCRDQISILGNREDYMSTYKIYEAVVDIAIKRLHAQTDKANCLDIGTGRGERLLLLSLKMAVVPHACDYHTERFKLDSVPIKKVNLNTDTLPYSDNSFDLVTCSEVIEHLENFRQVLRETQRVLRESGVLIVTTPNVLNIKSRARYFSSGFYNLFGPLPMKNDKLYSTGGHITPIPYFYLAHALMDAGFQSIQLTSDKIQRTSLFLLALTFPFIMFGWKKFLSKEKNKYKTLSDTNEGIVKKHYDNSDLVRKNNNCFGGSERFLNVTAKNSIY